MANIQKWTKKNFSGLLRNDRQSFGHNGQQKDWHPEREKENFIWTDVKFVQTGNNDKGKFQYSTINNFDWKDTRISDYIEQKKQKRLSEVKVLNRGNVIHDVSLTFTVPQDCRKEDELKCLKTAVYFMRKKLGTENFLCATFHFHESRPHVVVDCLPVVKDADGTERLSCKEVVTRRFLQNFHPELGVEVDKALGYHVSVETGQTRKDGRSINWMKEQEHKKEVRELKQQIKELESEKNYYRMRLIQDEGKLNFLKEDNPAVFNRVSRGTRPIDRPTVAGLESEYNRFIESKRKAGRARKKEKEQMQENERR